LRQIAFQAYYAAFCMNGAAPAAFYQLIDLESDMKRTITTFLLATVLGFGIGGCGSGSSGPPSTLGGACNEMGASFCQAEAKCVVGMSSSDCVKAFVSGCCGDDGTCGSSLNVDATSYNQCKNGLASMTCSNIQSVNLPTACTVI
jgi:hypothetical protein